MNNLPLLSILTFLPMVFSLIVLALPKDNLKNVKLTALVGTLVTLLISVFVWVAYAPHSGQTGPDAPYQLVERFSWIPQLNINYFLGVDGISLVMVLMTTGIFPFIVGVSSESISTRVKEYYFWVMLMETAILGVFLSVNLILFYVFWEAMLIPAYFIVGIWGGPKRIYATVKFFLYTMVGSMVMLVSILGLYLMTGSHSFDLTWLITNAPAVLNGHHEQSLLLFIGFFLAFGIKAPVWPFHTWVPDAYAEAPTGGTIILVALKMGLYGFIRFCLPLFPAAVHIAAPYIVTLAVIGVIYAAFVASVQTDLKRLLAYSSISHVGVIMLAIFGVTSAGINGAVLQMTSHTITMAALFIIVGALYSRRKSYLIADYGGLMSIMPTFTFVFLIATLSSVALPLTSGFSGEILMLIGSFNNFPVATGFATTAAIWSVVYMLWMFQRVMHGPLDKTKNQGLPDITASEKLALYPLIVLIFALGILPNIVLSKSDPSVDTVLTQYNTTYQNDFKVGTMSATTPDLIEKQAQLVAPRTPTSSMRVASVTGQNTISVKGDRE
jgi:NADH-quinone oxidoreductase subunit M